MGVDIIPKEDHYTILICFAREQRDWLPNDLGYSYVELKHTLDLQISNIANLTLFKDLADFLNKGLPIPIPMAEVLKTLAINKSTRD